MQPLCSTIPTSFEFSSPESCRDGRPAKLPHQPRPHQLNPASQTEELTFPLTWLQLTFSGAHVLDATSAHELALQQARRRYTGGHVSNALINRAMSTIELSPPAPAPPM